MAIIEVLSPAEAAAYTKRLLKVRARFEKRGYGSKQHAAFDLRIPPSRLSGVLNQRELNPTMLDQLEAWIEANPIPAA